MFEYAQPLNYRSKFDKFFTQDFWNSIESFSLKVGSGSIMIIPDLYPHHCHVKPFFLQ